MTTIEHLNKIKAKCEQLLAIAEKRTPGTWHKTRYASTRIENNNERQVAACGGHTSTVNAEAVELENHANTTFIASCAGPAEAGWRSTIAAIDLLLFNNERMSYGYAQSKQERQIIQSILSAWPEEILN